MVLANACGAISCGGAIACGVSRISSPLASVDDAVVANETVNLRPEAIGPEVVRITINAAKYVADAANIAYAAKIADAPGSIESQQHAKTGAQAQECP